MASHSADYCFENPGNYTKRVVGVNCAPGRVPGFPIEPRRRNLELQDRTSAEPEVQLRHLTLNRNVLSLPGMNEVVRSFNRGPG